MKVWIVFEEWNQSVEGDNAVIVGVYATEEAAKIAAENDAKLYESEPFNKQIWNRVPPSNPDDYDEGNWDLDIHIEEHDVLSLRRR